MNKSILLLGSCVILSCALADSPTPLEVLQQEIGGSVATINQKGHPIFITTCKNKEGILYSLVITANGISGLQLALKNGVITSMSEVTPSPTGDHYLVEADGGEYSQRNAEHIFAVLKARPFHLIAKLDLDNLAHPTDTSICDIEDVN